MNVVRIKRIRVNFQIRFGYVPTLNDYIKTIPREQCQTKMQPILQPDGTTKEDWFRICNPIGLVKIIWFCWDNGFKIEYDNIKESDIARIEEFATNRRTTLEKVEDFKKNGVDISNVDYSFMKIQPYAYQKEAVHFFEITNGRALLGDSPGVGKAQKLDALIATPDGWTRMGDLKIGQKVFHHNGDSYPITGIFPQGLIKSYKVIFNDGFSTECSLDHLWLVRDANRRRRGKGWVVKSLGELINSKLTYRFHQGRADSGRKQPLKWEIPIVEPIQYPEQNFIIPPYILGALIGDGYICGKTVTISIPDFQLNTLDKINSLLPTNLKTIGNRYSQCPQYNITQSFGNKILRNPYKIEINKLGLNVKSGQKFIPSIYLKGNINQRLDLLRGLMDTDGSADRNRINFHTTSKQLALDVSELVQSLGGQAILKIYDRSKENKPTEYRVNVRIKICPFYLPDKIKQWWPAKRNYPSRYIESVEEVDCFEQQCISVSSPDNTYITNNYIVTHNTLSATAYATKKQIKNSSYLSCLFKIKLA